MRNFRRKTAGLIIAFLVLLGAALPVRASSMNVSGGENRTPSVDPITESESFSAVL